jgi:hypothetical protein
MRLTHKPSILLQLRNRKITLHPLPQNRQSMPQTNFLTNPKLPQNKLNHLMHNTPHPKFLRRQLLQIINPLNPIVLTRNPPIPKPIMIKKILPLTFPKRPIPRLRPRKLIFENHFYSKNSKLIIFPKEPSTASQHPKSYQIPLQ